MLHYLHRINTMYTVYLTTLIILNQPERFILGVGVYG